MVRLYSLLGCRSQLRHKKTCWSFCALAKNQSPFFGGQMDLQRLHRSWVFAGLPGLEMFMALISFFIEETLGSIHDRRKGMLSKTNRQNR